MGSLMSAFLSLKIPAFIIGCDVIVDVTIGIRWYARIFKEPSEIEGLKINVAEKVKKKLDNQEYHSSTKNAAQFLEKKLYRKTKWFWNIVPETSLICAHVPSWFIILLLIIYPSM